jgi:hypothetical protein
MANMFPRTEVEGISLSRMIIGTNWVLGYSHTSPAADKLIRSRHSDPNNTIDMLKVFLDHGVDTMMGPFADNPALCEAVKTAEDKTGKKIIIVDTPILNVDDNADGRREAESVIAKSQALGAAFCLIHHSSAEQLVNKNKRTMDRLPDYLKMIRDHGMVPGLSAHMPELIVYSDANEYDVQTYIQIYNCMGFLMQVEVEYINKVIWGAKKPVMTIKPMAAGRVSPFVGLNFAWHTIRPCDMVTVGCFTPEEAAEDIEISMAAMEGRAPELEGRNSPNKTSIMKG